MNITQFKTFFQEECNKNQIKNEEKKAEKLFVYMNLILKWNESINLTAITDHNQFIVKHYVDSLLIDSFIKGANRVLDIGTGAGFPGIPLKIYNPDIEFTLIDSVNKKINVINDVIQKLGLKNIEALHIRAEDLAQNSSYREKFDIVTTRAVSNLTTICEYMLPFVKIGGKAICMKGPNIEEELKNSEKAIKILGGEIEKIEKINIDDEFERNIIVIKKIKNTEKKYPRGQGKPLKEPIK